MPLPIGHAAIGWAVHETAKDKTEDDTKPTLGSQFGAVALAALLANLPDLDVLFGLIFYGNGAAIHRGPMHSILFAVLAGYLASNFWRIWRRIPRFGFGLCFLIVFSHVAADMVLTSGPVSLLWPLEVNFSSGFSGWGQVAYMVLFQSIQDTGIVVVCLAYVNALRVFRRKTPIFPLFVFARKRVK